MTKSEFQTAIQPLLPRLYRICLGLIGRASDAEDALQNALIKAYAHRLSYSGDSPFIAWLSVIVRNECMEFIRTQARRRTLWTRAFERWDNVLGHDTDIERALTPERVASDKEQIDILLQALQLLDPAFREVVVLCDLDGVGHEHVAVMLRIPVGTVKSRHARGRSQLRKAFAKLEANLQRSTPMPWDKDPIQ